MNRYKYAEKCFKYCSDMNVSERRDTNDNVLSMTVSELSAVIVMVQTKDNVLLDKGDC